LCFLIHSDNPYDSRTPYSTLRVQTPLNPCYIPNTLVQHSHDIPYTMVHHSPSIPPTLPGASLRKLIFSPTGLSLSGRYIERHLSANGWSHCSFVFTPQTKIQHIRQSDLSLSLSLWHYNILIILLPVRCMDHTMGLSITC